MSLKTVAAYAPITLAVVGDPRVNYLSDGTEVVNLRGVIETGLVNKQIEDGNGNTIWVKVPKQDYFDIAAWSEETRAVAKTLVSGQTISFTPESIKGDKPYTTQTGDTRFSVKMTAYAIEPGAKPQRKAASQAPADAAAADLNEVPF
jgi:hypothetical protein